MADAERDPAGTGSPAPESERQRGARVRAARTAQHRRWADLQVEEAMRRGDFDALPGAGRPLRLDGRRDPHWWVKRLIERENLDAAAPPAIALRLEDERLDDELDAQTTERDVRRVVIDFNRRVVDARRQLLGGPPVITPVRDADLEVIRWRERRARRRDEASSRRASAEAEAGPTQRSRGLAQRLRARRRRDDRGAGRAAVVGSAALAVAVAAGLGAVLVSAAGSEEPQASRPPTAPRPSASAPAAPATPAPSAAGSAQAAVTEECSSGRGAFRPTSVTIPDVARRIQVVYPPRDSAGIPGTPPLSAEGKTQMAYDTENGIAPGAEAGNALFNAHTWPDGSALGNALLRELRVGDLLQVQGRDGRTQCYRLARRVQVPATVSGKQYYRRAGAPRMAIVVCSGSRVGSGDWSHRTLFFAAPVA